MLDENKWLAARHGLDGELVDLPEHERVPTRELARRLLDRLRPHAEELGSAAELDGHRGPARARQRRRAPGASSTRRTTTSARSCARSSPPPCPRRAEPPGDTAGRRRIDRVTMSAARPLRRLQELRVGGEPVHHRVPVLRQRGCASGRRSSTATGGPPRSARAPAPLAGAVARAAAARARSPGSAPTRARTRRSALVGASLVLFVAAARRRREPRSTWRSSARRTASWWRVFDGAVRRTTNSGYAFVALFAIALFGWLLERRHGRVVAAAAVPRRRGAAGMAVAVGGRDVPDRARRQRRRARRCSPPGRSATCSPRAAAARTTATCSAPP